MLTPPNGLGAKIEPETPDAAAGSLLTLLHMDIASATAEGSDALSLTFADGSAIRIEPDATFEAWTVARPRGHCRDLVVD